MKRNNSLMLVGIGVLLTILAGCTKEKTPGASSAAAPEAAPAPSNRIDIPPAVRTNLGITFAKVESRNVAATRRYPGRFELPPQARRQYHAMLPGRVELVAKQYQPVQVGDLLFRIDSPQWRELQEKLASEVVAMRTAQDLIKASDERRQAIAEHEKGVAQITQVWKQRLDEVTKLMEAGGGGAAELAEARSRMADALTESAKVREEIAELNESRAKLNADISRFRQTMPLLYAEATGQPANPDDVAPFDVTMARVASLTGYSVEELMKPVASTTGAPALSRWRTIDRIEVKATNAGVVESIALTGGAWAETGATVLVVVDPTEARFRAVIPQSDLPVVMRGLTGTILSPQSDGSKDDAGAAVKIQLGIEADPDQRTMEVIATPSGENLPLWARAGISSQLEVVIDGNAKTDLAIPSAAIIQDGLEYVYFRRDPRDPDKVIRVVGDLGLNDGEWVIVASGVREGDEVVLKGVYELKLASSNSGQAKGGHFHADGTWHADGTPETK